jgi:hypothetical protein
MSGPSAGAIAEESDMAAKTVTKKPGTKKPGGKPPAKLAGQCKPGGPEKKK